MNRLSRCAFILSAWFALACRQGFADAPTIDFDRQIRPILSQHCFHCHGPDPKHREAGLRFDKFESATAELESGEIAIVPGKPDESALVARVFTTDVDELMPPPDSNRDLSDKQKTLLRRWIAEGAKFEKHWAFLPPQRPPLPKISTAEWPRNPIDHFVLARLDRERLSPSAEADKETLIRRLSLDLTGLPPTIEEVDTFLADKSPGAYEKVVDRLLASPRYGEHMAHAWLDAARYADTNGFQQDRTRTMWPWRDWVVRAMNENKPFDEFTVEQLAGDLLPGATDTQRLATGFHRNHMLNGEGGRIAEESRVNYVFDRVSTTGSVWLGMTLGCAQCHDHKYDPFSQEDFYRMYAFFNNVEERGNVDRGGNANPVIKIRSPEQVAKLEKERARLASLQRDLAKVAGEEAMARWEQTLDKTATAGQTWIVLRPSKATAGSGATATIEADGTVFVPGKNAKNDRFVVEAPTDVTSIAGLRLEAIAHPSFTAGGFAPSNSGNFVLTELEVDVYPRGKAEAERIKMAAAVADYSQNGFAPKLAVDGSATTGWAVWSKNMKENRTAVFTFAEGVAGGAGTRFVVRLKHDSRHEHHNLQRFRISLTSWPKPSLEPDSIASILRIARDQRTAEQTERLLAHFRASRPEAAKIQKQIEKAKATIAAIGKSGPETMVMKERATPRDTYRLIRGAWDQPDKSKKLAPGVPEQWLRQAEGAPANRLGLARWITDPQNPLTARVTTNRYWQHFFGAGMVTTPEDFGLQGDPPSHPQLLDWLATEFVRSGWNVKAMHRLIVTSATYRQSSRATPAALERDRYNRLLARGARFRLSSQAIRDQALALSGLLIETMGGPGVQPYQPLGIWSDATLGKIKYKVGTGEALYRRSLYTFWRRMVGPTMFFDTSARQVCTVRQSRTNTPLHALTLMNDITYVEAARKLAERMMREGGKNLEPRIDWAIRHATARTATKEERDALAEVYNKMLTRFQKNEQAAKELLAVGQSPHDTSLDRAQLAAYTGVANVILNLDEVVTRE